MWRPRSTPGRPSASSRRSDPEAARSWAAAEDLGDLDLAAIARHPKAVETIEAGVADAMAEFNQAERVKRVSILHEEWLPDSECLTPTSKLKRRGIHARFADEIEKLYS